jgi:hypothetical protein
VRIPIDQLWQGQSKQPPWKVIPGQLPQIVNFTCDVLVGARKRNATDLIADIAGSILDSGTDYYITSLREFRVFIGDRQIVVLDAQGNQIPVIDETATDFQYLEGFNSTTGDSTASIDTLVMVNRTKRVAMEATDDYDVLSEVINYSDLFKTPEEQDDLDPTEQPVGAHFRVLEDENLDVAGIYAKTYKDPDGNAENDMWERVPAPADPDGHADRTTWPHRLVYLPDSNTFAYDVIPFNDRLSGNSITNEVFPFVGQTIQSVRFMDGRLFFIGRDSLNATAASDIFTIFGNNVNNLTDDDRLSLDITQKNVGLPLRSEVVGEALVILCENGQLSFGSADQALTAINGRIRQISSFKGLDIYPGTDGKRLVMMDADKATRVFQWDELSRSVQYVGSTTEHVTGLFDDQNIESIVLDNTTTFVLTDTSTVWVHDMYFEGNALKQSAWSKYEFNETVKHIDAWADRIRLISLGETWTLMTYSHRKAINPGGFDFDPRLDRRQLLQGIYLSDLDQTQFELENRDASMTRTWVVTTIDHSGNTSIEWFQPVWVNGRKFRIEGKWSNSTHYVGWEIDSEIELSKLWAGPADVRPMLNRVNVFHDESTDYLLEAGAERGKQRRVEWNSNYLNTRRLNESMVETGVNSNLVLGDARYTTVRISNSTPGTVTVSAIELVVNRKGRA